MLVPMQPDDVSVTYADTSALERDFGFKPSTSLRDGLRKFVEWYKEFYQINNFLMRDDKHIERHTYDRQRWIICVSLL